MCLLSQSSFWANRKVVCLSKLPRNAYSYTFSKGHWYPQMVRLVVATKGWKRCIFYKFVHVLEMCVEMFWNLLDWPLENANCIELAFVLSCSVLFLGKMFIISFWKGVITKIWGNWWCRYKHFNMPDHGNGSTVKGVLANCFHMGNPLTSLVKTIKTNAQDHGNI